MAGIFAGDGFPSFERRLPRRQVRRREQQHVRAFFGHGNLSRGVELREKERNKDLQFTSFFETTALACTNTSRSLSSASRGVCC